MDNRKNKGKSPAGQPPKVPTPIGPVAPPAAPTAFTPEQLEAAQQQAAQRLRTEHAVLKAQFADAAVALAIAVQEREQLVQRVQASQKIIEQLSAELEELRQAADDAEASGQPDDAEARGPQDDPEPAPDLQPEEA